MANNIEAGALLVFTRRGNMAALLSRCRPNSPIFAFTNMSTVRRRLNIYWGVSSYRIEFSKDPEKTIQRSIDYLKERQLIESGILMVEMVVQVKFWLVPKANNLEATCLAKVALTEK